MKNKKTLYLIDGSSFLYRAYYGLKPLHTPSGEPVQAVYSFIRMIKKLIDQFDPTYCAVVWDSKGKTVRHEIYEEYKAQRQEPPSDMFSQKVRIQEFADLIELQQVAQQGVEADDLMYSLAKDFSDKDFDVVFITSDKDMCQALSERVHIFDPFKNIFITQEFFEQEQGFPVEKLPFYYGLLGDASDNIPGVRGIGKKTAADLVKEFDSLHDLYNRLDVVKKERTRTLLAEQKEQAFLSQDLFTFKYYVLNYAREDFSFDKTLWSRALPLFELLNFKSLVASIAPDQVKKITPLSELKGYAFKCIVELDELKKVCQEVREHKRMAFDTELTGVKPLQDELVGVSVCVKEGESYYIPFGHTTIEKQLERSVVFEYLAPLLADPAIEKIMHHAKFDQLALAHYGLEVHGLVFDTLIAAHLVTQDWQRISLKVLSEFYLQETMLSYSDVVTSNGYKHFGYVPLALATEYAAADAHQTLKLVSLLYKQLKEQHMEELCQDIELPLMNVLFVMEREGIYLDTQILHVIDEHVTKDLHTIKEKILALLPSSFQTINLNSPKQLAELLFDHLKLPPQKKTGGRTSFSTDQEVLEALSKLHPVPALIVRYRELFKIKSTYLDALPTYINPQTGRIHTTFSQTNVATGRLSSSDPNLQNIPTRSVHYGDLYIRSAFKATGDRVFVSADYSQIELRVLAYFSQDEALVNAFLQNQDIHKTTAAKLFDCPLDQVTSEQRQIGKRINFSILYGLTPYGLSKDLDISFNEAKVYIERYFAQYPHVQAWMESVVRETKEFGYVTTYWGRRRYIPGIYEQNKNLYDLARRVAINTKAQGTAAEIMKIGMIDLVQAFKKHTLDAHVRLQIHDEVLVSTSRRNMDQVQKIMKDVLEAVVSWNVPLIVDVRSGANWQEVTK